jgi:hypothetical protein
MRDGDSRLQLAEMTSLEVHSDTDAVWATG